MVVWSWVCGALVLLNVASLSRMRVYTPYTAAQGSKREKVEILGLFNA